jgi:hypothetical protein
MNIFKSFKTIFTLLVIAVIVAGCSSPALKATVLPASPVTVATELPPTAGEPDPDNGDLAARLGLTEAQVATLRSLEQVDGYPLYTMHYHADYQVISAESSFGQSAVSENRTPTPSWACSLLAALGDPDGRLYGRNFDWEYSPAVLLYTDPLSGYASVSMVDIAYLGFGGPDALNLSDHPLETLLGLLDAPYLPFDGFNEMGVAIGMAAVPDGDVPPDPEKETLGSLRVIRAVLDQAADVDEAVAILIGYNIDFSGGPPIHYLVADRSGHSALVEHYMGEVKVIPNQSPWHHATNFLRSSEGDLAEGVCWRYDKIQQELNEMKGKLTAQEAMSLLEAVSQENTQWSIVYGMNTGEVHVAMDRKYQEVHVLHLDVIGK